MDMSNASKKITFSIAANLNKSKYLLIQIHLKEHECFNATNIKVTKIDSASKTTCSVQDSVQKGQKRKTGDAH